MGKRSRAVEVLVGNMGSIRRETSAIGRRLLSFDEDLLAIGRPDVLCRV
jgi:hypothetical protein